MHKVIGLVLAIFGIATKKLLYVGVHCWSIYMHEKRHMLGKSTQQKRKYEVYPKIGVNRSLHCAYHFLVCITHCQCVLHTISHSVHSILHGMLYIPTPHLLHGMQYNLTTQYVVYSNPYTIYHSLFCSS